MPSSWTPWVSDENDAPALDIAYKLTSYAGRPRLKLSMGKPTMPGPKQIFREAQDGLGLRDTIARADEDLPGRPLLQPVMRAGKRLAAGMITLDEARAYAAAELAALPAALRSLRPARSGLSRRGERGLQSLWRGCAQPFTRQHASAAMDHEQHGVAQVPFGPRVDLAAGAQEDEFHAVARRRPAGGFFRTGVARKARRRPAGLFPIMR